LAQAWLPILTAVLGAVWGLWIYLDDQETARRQAADLADKESRTRLIEAQKPFLDKQLELYFETAQLVGRLVQEPKNTPKWEADVDRFWQLYWSELSMVEHQVVETAMVRFGSELRAFLGGQSPDRNGLQRAALDLAHAIRGGIEQSWGGPGSEIVAP